MNKPDSSPTQQVLKRKWELQNLLDIEGRPELREFHELKIFQAERVGLQLKDFLERQLRIAQRVLESSEAGEIG